MRILYLSCHSILEYDEIKMLTELGHYVFSPGAYVEPENPGDHSLRPGIFDIKYDPEDVAEWHKLGKPGKDNKECLTKEFVDRFDAVIIMHLPRWIHVNWNVMKHKPVIWRTIGQSIANNERELAPYRNQGLKIIRYSPREATTPGYIGSDALIRFYKDPDEFGNWNGNELSVITFAQHMIKREQACQYSIFEAATRPFPRKLYGPGNEAAGNIAMGKVPYDTLKAAMRDHRVYFYTGTHPASYTLNFMEAWMTGIPIVAIGPKLGNASYFPGHSLYEIPDLIKDGENGFISDDIATLTRSIKMLLDDPDLAQKISQNGRDTAIKTFGKQTVATQWSEFLKTLG